MFKIFQLVLALVGINSLFLSPIIFATEKPSDSAPCIQISADKIRSSCQNVSLMKILTTIYHKKGVVFSISEENLNDRVTAKFAYLPMEEGVQKFLRGRNYSFIYDKDGKLMKVVYLGRKRSVNLSSIVNPPIDSKKEEKIEQSQTDSDSTDDRMTISDSGHEVMNISSTGEKMEITSDGAKMDINDDGEAMTVDSGDDEMKVSDDQ